MADIDTDRLWTAATNEGRRLARLAFEHRGNESSIHLEEPQFAQYLALGFEAGVQWALTQK